MSNREPLASNEKVIIAAKALLAYPNPVQSNGTVILEGVTEGSLLEVYSQSGATVLKTIATGSPVILTLDVSPGLYIIRTEIGEIKVIVK
jgi:hypothetical protein